MTDTKLQDGMPSPVMPETIWANNKMELRLSHDKVTEKYLGPATKYIRADLASPDAVRKAVEALRAIETDLCKRAAILVRCEGLPSDCAEDHKRKVPKWVLQEFDRILQRSVYQGNELGKLYRRIREVTEALRALEQGDRG